MSSLDSFAWQLTQLSLQAKRPVLLIVNHNRELHECDKRIQFFDTSLKTLLFPDWELLPYERLSPAPAQIYQRLKTLDALHHCQEGIIITTASALLRRLPPKDYIRSHVFHFSLHDPLDITQLGRQLAHAGYQRVTQVTVPGEYTIRGELIEIFPLESRLPFRLHTDCTIIENIYYFDPVTQAPCEPIRSIRVIPTREFLLSEESIHRFNQQGQQHFGARWFTSLISQQLSINSHPPGIEYYIPLFFTNTDSLLDYLPKHTHWISHLDLMKQLMDCWTTVSLRYQQLASDIQWPILPPETLYAKPASMMAQLKSFKAANVAPYAISDLPDLYETNAAASLQKLAQFLKTKTHPKVLFSITRMSQSETFVKKLQSIGIEPLPATDWNKFLENSASYQMSTTPLKKGFSASSPPFLIIPDARLYTSTSTEALKATPTTRSTFLSFNNLAQLTINDFVVHVDHGIGRYLGLECISLDEALQEFIVLAYADDTKLYVPIQDIQLISRYIGQNPTLHHLSSIQWQKTKQKALTQLKDVACELLQLYAKRAQTKGEIFKAPNADYDVFKAAFNFEETPDQTKAIADIISDFSVEQPMDRLVCGDVGFGKTEVAMQAAFLAIQSGKQVAVLAPTTLLVDQHYRNFKERFSEWPITIDWLSRFRKPASQRLVKQAIAEAKLDIIIGTQTLLSKQLRFKHLGLVIVDEEHHFGVQQKERLSALKSNVNVLTLTATPIPRTLQTTLSGLRDLSLITTSPKGRLSIKSFVTQRESATIREAILRELSRGGQVYFVHNRVADLERVARELQQLIPNARIKVAHGQLSEQELEARMNAFYEQHYNILVCTSIIETGLDIPTVNTLIVDQADHFGLAQLHQLRGRVGRSHHQAYAYFLVSQEASLNKNAYKRLNALSRLDQLGSGFNLATQDLDIRGAGELLGEKQSGHLDGMGFALYMELLEKTIQSMQCGKKPENDLRTVLDLKIPAFIPESYLRDISKRLEYYQVISKAANAQALEKIQMELLNRYGLFPEAIKNLFAITRLKQIAQSLGIDKIEANKQSAWLVFDQNSKVDFERVLHMVQKEPSQFKLVPNPLSNQPRLRCIWDRDMQPQQRIIFIEAVLKQFE